MTLKQWAEIVRIAGLLSPFVGLIFAGLHNEKAAWFCVCACIAFPFVHVVLYLIGARKR